MLKNIYIKENILGGITAAIIALPLALAFGVASGLGPTAGLYGAIILGFIASLFGGTPTQIPGPTGPMTVVIAASVVTLHKDINLLASVVIIAGMFQVLFGVLKLGKFVRYIPYPVISGFMSGIGIIIIILQINPFLGLDSDASIVHILYTLPQHIAQINLSSLLLAVATLSIMFFTPVKISSIIPTPLIALLLLTPISTYFGLHVTSIGEIPSTLPNIVIPTLNFEEFKVIFQLGFTLAILGMIDTLLTSVVADSISGNKHKPNKELVAQGIGNAVCGLFGAVPGAGATMRTVINKKSGGTNNISGISHALILLLTALFLAPIAATIPLAILSGILIKVGFDILDYRFISIWRESPKSDLLVMSTVLFITVFIDLITAVGVGILLSSLLVTYRITQETKICLRTKESTKENYTFDKYTRLLKIDGAFFFGSSIAFEEEISSILDIKTFIMDISDVPFVDLTAIFTLKDLVVKLKKDSIVVKIIASKKFKDQLLGFNKNSTFDGVTFYEDLASLQ